MHPTTCILLITLVTLSSSTQSIYDFKVNDIKGNVVDMASFRGKALLILNTASQCGHTDSHLKALKRLHEILSYENRFEIIAFPCNDFGEQDPWEATEIEEFVKSHHKCEFPLMEKVKIKGEDAHPLWKFIGESTGKLPTWNFEKYLFDSTGNYVNSWDANTSIESIFDEIKTVVDKVKIKQEPDSSSEANKVEL